MRGARESQAPAHLRCRARILAAVLDAIGQHPSCNRCNNAATCQLQLGRCNSSVGLCGPTVPRYSLAQSHYSQTATGATALQPARNFVAVPAARQKEHNSFCFRKATLLKGMTRPLLKRIARYDRALPKMIVVD